MYSGVCYDYSSLCRILNRELGFTILHSSDISCQLCIMLATTVQLSVWKAEDGHCILTWDQAIGSNAQIYPYHCQMAVVLYRNYEITSRNAAKLFMIACSSDAYLACKPAYTP